jgi:hypothetical protein
MARKTGKGVEAAGRVRDLRERIAQWRRTREKRSVMPAELWQEAVTLARSKGTYAVARGVRIDYQSLARRVAETRAGHGGESGCSRFVELSGAELLGASTLPGPVVELYSSEGVRLTIRWGGSTPLDVAGLVHSFCQHRS